MGTTAMGLPTTPGTIVISPLNGPGPFSAVTQPGTPGTTLAPVPLASDPDNAGDGRDLRCTDRTNRAWDAGGAGYVHVGNSRHNRTAAIGFRGTDDTGRSGGSFRVHNG